MLLIPDRMEWEAFNIRYVSVGWRGRAPPLLWQMLNPGASSFAEQREDLSTIARWMPEGAKVILLGDRAFGTGVLALVYTWLCCGGLGRRHRPAPPGRQPAATYVEPLADGAASGQPTAGLGTVVVIPRASSRPDI